MRWQTTPDVAGFLAAAGDFLSAGPVEHTLSLTIAHTVRDDGPGAFGAQPPLFGWGGDPVTAAFTHTPPHPVVLATASGDAAAALADRLAGDGWAVSGVNGPAEAADAFARAWCARAGGTPVETMRTRLYQLVDLSPPDPAPDGAPARSPRPTVTGRSPGWRRVPARSVTCRARPASWSTRTSRRAG
ncbi:hypothetical protein ACFQX7_02365 [Luedemannella flava]